jgi:hypothetical protein
MAGHVLGGVKENPAAANSAESDGLGCFAVDEHNKRQASFAPLPVPRPLLSSARRFGRFGVLFLIFGVRFCLRLQNALLEFVRVVEYKCSVQHTFRSV